MPWRAKSRSTLAFCIWMRRVWRRVLGGSRRDLRGFWWRGDDGERMEVWIWRTGEMSRVWRMWEESAVSWSWVRGVPEGERDGGGLDERREMDICSRLSRSAWTVWSCTRVEEADEPERMVWRIESMGSRSQFEKKPLRVEVVVVRRWERWGLIREG